MRKLWSNLRERTQGNEKRQIEDSSHPKATEGLLKATARKNYPNSEDVDNPMLAPQDYDVRQSGRVLELPNRDLWLRPADFSWHFPILVTNRKDPFRNFRGRSPAKMKAREDKIEEAKKQKTLKNKDDEVNSARWQPSSWTWTTSSSSFAWREWSSDQTRERSDWQSADRDSSDQVRELTAWRSSGSWQSHFFWH